MEFKGVIIDAGHGGMDSGAVGNNLQEKDLTLEAATYIYNRLQELGIPSKMTRTEDEYLPKEQRIKRVLSLYNNDPNTILISNHINAGGGEGAEVVYSLKNDSTLANLILDHIEEKGQIKRKAYQRRLPESPNQDYYYILRESGLTEPVLIEYGFIDNTKDANKLRRDLKNYAEGVVEAIAEYLNVSYNSTAKEEYIVEKGDTLYSISRRFQVPVSEIKRINQLTSDLLQIGQVLYLTEREPEENIYIVQKGDSLWKIAKQYQIPVTELIEMNQLEDLTIQIGQSLKVPSKTEKDTYIVEKGDTLWSIAKKLGMTVSELKEMNSLSNNLLSIGQVLKTK